MRKIENRRLGFDMTLTCTRKGEIYRREERGERREERGERKGIKWALAQWRDFNTFHGNEVQPMGWEHD